MKFLLTLLVSCVLLSVNAQTQQQEINQQIWKPFIQAYNSFDTEKFMSLYSKDVIRVPRDQQKILTFSEYKKNINRENQHNKNYNIKASIEVRFTDRIYTSTTAYEMGVYKISMIENTGKNAVIYSRFQVLLRKENNVWKIFIDTDPAEACRVTEKEFQAAKPME